MALKNIKNQFTMEEDAITLITMSILDLSVEKMV
jgi:hypothetical protein